MKFSIKVIVTVFILTLVSCSEDFLDKQDPTLLGEETFYKTETQVNQAVTGIYGQLQGIVSSQWLFQELITDNTTIHFNEGDRGQAPNIESFEYWQYNNNTGRIYGMYRGIYNALGNINLVLAKLSDAEIDTSTKARFEGEVKFYRGYYYFLLSQYFGDAVIITEPIRNPSDAFEFSRSPISEIYALIETDLAFAISSLPEAVDASQAGRITKGAALTLQAKVLLTRKDYTAAKALLDQVVASGVYDLLPNYADIFDPNNKNHTESIFEVQFQGNNDLGEWSGFIYNFYPLFSQGAVTGFPGIDGGGWNIPTNNMIAAYEVGDLRKEVSLSEGYISNDGDFVAVPYIEKFRNPHTILRRPNDNWPVYRYADVLLMLAEAINETSGPTGEAYGYLNQVRSRAGLDPLGGLSQEAFKTALLQERRIELAFENHRWFDLKRNLSDSELVMFMNNHGAEEIAGPTTPRGSIGFSASDYQFDAFELLFPIPERELLVNPDLEQNEGY